MVRNQPRTLELVREAEDFTTNVDLDKAISMARHCGIRGKLCVTQIGGGARERAS